MSFGQVSGPPEPIDLGVLAAKGSLSVSCPYLYDYIFTDEDLKWRSSEVFDWILKDKVKFGDFTILPLSDGKRAYEMLETGKSTGKILMKA